LALGLTIPSHNMLRLYHVFTQDDVPFMRCAAYCTATSFNIPELLIYLRTNYGLHRFREVLYIRYPLDEHVDVDEGETPKEGDVFIFPYGAIVCWGMRDDLERRLLHELKPFEVQPVDIVEDDIFSYEYGEQANIKEDDITLPDHDNMTKLAFSHGIAQSVKLGIFEQTIQKTIHLTRDLPEFLAQQGSIRLSRKDIRRMMGRLFIDRSSINLHQELLDTPEFFWDHSDLEPYYAKVAHYLDRERRVHVMNQRLNIVQEIFDMLAAELNHQHSARLEWTIIILIVIEVVLSVARDVFKII